MDECKIVVEEKIDFTDTICFASKKYCAMPAKPLASIAQFLYQHFL
jgi:hypothetical protein